MANVGKYTIPLECLGNKLVYNSTFLLDCICLFLENGRGGDNIVFFFLGGGGPPIFIFSTYNH